IINSVVKQDAASMGIDGVAVRVSPDLSGNELRTARSAAGDQAEGEANRHQRDAASCQPRSKKHHTAPLCLKGFAKSSESGLRPRATRTFPKLKNRAETLSSARRLIA